MRIVVLLLIVANLALFAYTSSTACAVARAAPAEQVDPDKIRILTPQQVAALGPAKVAALADVCAEWGPFSDAERAKALADLESLQLGTPAHPAQGRHRQRVLGERRTVSQQGRGGQARRRVARAGRDRHVGGGRGPRPVRRVARHLPHRAGGARARRRAGAAGRADREGRAAAARRMRRRCSSCAIRASRCSRASRICSRSTSAATFGSAHVRRRADPRAAIGGRHRGGARAVRGVRRRARRRPLLPGLRQELASLPGAYAPPRGRLLLAGAPAAPVGCVACAACPSTAPRRDVARSSGSTCDPLRAARGSVRRSRAAIRRGSARAIGYREARLDTLASMTAARALYESLGFRECAAVLPQSAGRYRLPGARALESRTIQPRFAPAAESGCI